jgi:hypothetical protein
LETSWSHELFVVLAVERDLDDQCIGSFEPFA